jgi:CRP-like cAMP-binding protein
MFAGLDAAALAEVNALCRAVDFDEGESIYHAGDRAERLFIVALGIAKLTRVSSEGREVLTDVLAPGDFLGALPALGQSNYAESASALTPACLLLFEARSIDLILKGHPEVAVATLEAVSGRLAAAQTAIHRLSTDRVESRLAATLELLLERVGEPDDAGILLQVPLTRDDLAAMTGSTPETVSRILSAWRKRGLVEAGRRWVRILDRAGLTRIRTG